VAPRGQPAIWPDTADAGKDRVGFVAAIEIVVAETAIEDVVPVLAEHLVVAGAASRSIAAAGCLDRACRVFEVTTADADRRATSLGVACRSPEGRWTVEGVAHPLIVDPNQAIKPTSGP
jgi:hypothetical protein